MLIEMRRYTVEAGAMDRMHERMTDVLFPLFDEHDVPRPKAIWENREDTSTLTWLIEWPNYDVRSAAWAVVGPAFAAVRVQQGTPEFVTRTTLTLIAPWPGSSFAPDRAGSCEAMWHVQPRIGLGAAFTAFCSDTIFSQLQAVGASACAGANLIFGALPQAAILVSWPDPQTRASGLRAISDIPSAGLPDMVLGSGASLGICGQWETLDRAPYPLA
jgi:hypothetical protein